MQQGKQSIISDSFPLRIAQKPDVGATGSIEAFASHALTQAVIFDWKEWPRSAPNASKAIPVITLDATKGVCPEDIYNIQLVRFLSLTDPVVLVDKMDAIGFEWEQFDLIEEEFRQHLKKANLSPLLTIPGPQESLMKMPWHLESDQIRSTLKLAAGKVSRKQPLRVSIKSVVHTKKGWLLEGLLMGGTVCEGDRILSSPSNQTATVRQVLLDSKKVSRVSFADYASQAAPQQPRLNIFFNEPFFAEPGEILSHVDEAPVVTDVFCLTLHWTGDTLMPGDLVYCERSGHLFEATLQSIRQVIDPLERKSDSLDALRSDRFAQVILRTPDLVALDAFSMDDISGVCSQLIRVSDAAGTGTGEGFISMDGYPDQRPAFSQKATNITPVINAVSDQARRDRNGHGGGVLWFTGLSGSGKSTLAMALEERLFERGYQVFVLDGDNVRKGLTSNLGFSPDDRAENIRRVGEVAALFRQAGIITISSFISPYRSDRDRARHMALSGFHEVYIKAKVETCIARDPKGLYKRALRGDIQDFTGISAPYEEPDDPEMILDTEVMSIDQCVDLLVNYVDTNFRL